jgi:hypothetical protein
MPIRFRCAYCNQLMAIARRKAGTVVRCPTCAGQVVVPALDAPPGPLAPNAPSAPPPQGAFERSDFEQVFQQEPAPAAPPVFPPVPKAAAGAAGAPAEALEVEAVPWPSAGAWPTSAPGGMVLTPGRATLLGIMVLVLLGLSFIAGLLIGRSS